MHHTQLERTARYRATPRGAYCFHKANAKYRGVPFLLTYRQWLCIWCTSGHWRERGNRPQQYVMARKGDRGAYACGNVSIKTNAQNRQEAYNTTWQADGPRRRHTKRTTTVRFSGDPGPDVPF